MALIEFKDIWEMYRIKFVIEGKVTWDNFWALKGISFCLEKSEALGIIGENGAGKSTVLKLIMGMLKPDRGQINVSGRVAGLLELGAGFEPELTGKENIYLNASLFGLSQGEIDKIYDEIRDFAALGKFIYAPVKCYSQGMFVRLAFAIAIHVDPDILLIDDTLAVGDEYFQRKCIKRIFELKEQGKTIIVVAHDLNILRRLCLRTILLKEGRIVKDDATEKVIPLYTQMTGDREGVGILENKPLTVVFNNGRLFISWLDKLLTPHFGTYTSLLANSKWYNSFQADWQVKKENENTLVAKGKIYQLDLAQIWRVELINNQEIKLDIEAEPGGAFAIQEGHTNIMLTNDYTHWFVDLERGEFAPLEEKNTNWQAIIDTDKPGHCIGVERRECPEDTPALVFQRQEDTFFNRAQIFNSDYFTNSRILQYKTLGLKESSLVAYNRLSFFSGKIVLNIKDMDLYLKNLQDKFILEKGTLSLICDSGKIIISDNGVPLTKAGHINTLLFINGRWYSSDLSHWVFEKVEQNKIIARGNWADIPITQIWEIELLSDSSFSWEIILEVKEEVSIEKKSVQFSCVSDYRYWFSEYGSGAFPDNFMEADTDMMQRCIPDGRVAFYAQNNLIPSLSLSFDKGMHHFAKIFNSSFYNKARIIRLENIDPEEKVKYPPGKYRCFKMDLSLREDIQARHQKPDNILENGKLTFIFENGKGRIYWDKLELTKMLGLYTSLRSQGRWHDSHSQALWRIKERDKGRLKVEGKWRNLPITQHWEVGLDDSNAIYFNVFMKVDKEVELDRLQTNIMLSEKYKEWEAGQYRGAFSQFRGDIDDDWEVLWSSIDTKEKKIEFLAAANDSNKEIQLPTVIFMPEITGSNFILNIVNSDLSHRGRILQYLNKEKNNILPGEYHYFQGRIKLRDS